MGRRWLADREGNPIALPEEMLAVAARVRPKGALTLEDLAPILTGDAVVPTGAGAMTWGEVASLMQYGTAPGGRLSKQAAQFSGFGPAGLFCRLYDSVAPVRASDLEAYAVYTAPSLAANPRRFRRPPGGPPCIFSGVLRRSSGVALSPIPQCPGSNRRADRSAGQDAKGRRRRRAGS